MAFYQGYFDESGKHQTHRVVSFSGVVDCDWEQFARGWNAKLADFQIPYLHLSKHSLKATDKQLAMFKAFIGVIKRTIHKGFAYSVDVPAFDGLHKSVRRELGGDAHYLAFSTTLLGVVDYASKLPYPAVAVVCDDDPSKVCESYKWFNRFRQDAARPQNRDVLRSIAFADDKYYPQLQAADLLSWVTRAEASHRFFGEPFRLRALFEEFNRATDDCIFSMQSAFWSSAYMEEISKGIRENQRLRDKRKKK